MFVEHTCVKEEAVKFSIKYRRYILDISGYIEIYQDILAI